jgi:hypothetical protein
MENHRVRRLLKIVLLVTVGLALGAAAAAEDGKLSIFEKLPFRAIGPAVMGGRIDDIAVVEDRPWIFYVGAASGGLWKTVNHGITFEPVFDHEGTASIGDITQPVEVQADPALSIPAAESRGRYLFLLSVNQARARVEEAIRGLSQVIEQAGPLIEKWKQPSGQGETQADILEKIRSFSQEAERLRGTLSGSAGEEGPARGPRGELRSLYLELDGEGVRAGTLSGPTPTQKKRFEMLSSSAEKKLGDVRALMGIRLPELNRELNSRNLPHLR